MRILVPNKQEIEFVKCIVEIFSMYNKTVSDKVDWNKLQNMRKIDLLDCRYSKGTLKVLVNKILILELGVKLEPENPLTYFHQPCTSQGTEIAMFCMQNKVSRRLIAGRKVKNSWNITLEW